VWRLVDRFVAELWRSGPLFFLIGISPGLTLWQLARRGGQWTAGNDLSIAERHSILAWSGASLLITLALAVALFLSRRRTDPGADFAAVLAGFNRYAFIVVALPLAGWLSGSIETTMPVLTLALIATLAALAATFTYRLLGVPRFAPPDEPFRAAGRPWLAKLVLAAAMLAYVALFSILAVTHHHNLATHFYDIGVYDNVVWNTLHGDFLDTTLAKGGDHSSGHFDPILALIALPYALYPRTESLLVVQTLWLCSGALAVWMVARRRLTNEWLATLCALSFLLYPALHGTNLFDFHSLALIIPLVVWLIYLLDAGRLRLVWPVLALLLLCREDVSLLCCLVAVYAILSGHTKTGVAMLVVSLTYLVIVKNFFMPDSSLLMEKSDKAHSYVYYFEDMIPYPAEGARGLATTVLTNPLHTLAVLCKPERVLFFLRLVLPLLALPLIVPRKRVMFLYGFAFMGLASRTAVYSLHFQYASLLFPLMFTALPDGIRRVVDSEKLGRWEIPRARLAWALVVGLMVASVATSVEYGAIVPNRSFRAGFFPLQRSHDALARERYLWVRRIIEQRIGPSSPVSATDSLGPHLTNRKDVYQWTELGNAKYALVRPGEFGKHGKKLYEDLKRTSKIRLLESKHGIELWEILYPGKPGVDWHGKGQ
jgi:uncharacterized membrane protein